MAETPAGWSLRPDRGTARRWFEVPAADAPAISAEAARRGMTVPDYLRWAEAKARGLPVDAACVPLAAIATDALQAEIARRETP